MTSVKEVLVDREPGEGLGRGRFRFTDGYSVFDWGTMPDPIPRKGASLCAMGADNFERLERAGVPTHYRGVVADGAVVDLDDATEPPEEMAIDLVRVPDLPYDGGDGTGEGGDRDGGYDYDAYHAAGGESYLVPLEVVFRNVVPVGSSLRGRADPADVGLDGEEWPDGPVDLDEPVVEFSTKFEEQDRYLSRSEADRIAGRASLEELERVAHRVNDLVTDRAAEVGFDHQDGKIECLSHRGEVRVADVAGTFDENRFSYGGQQVSKEVIRQYYKRAHPEWVEAVGDAKAAARDRGVADWRTLCDRDPPALPDDVVDLASDLYAAGANAYTGRAWFDAPPIDAVVDAVREFAGDG
ncbi:phosphoribosylaminoimidazolesuccinocarboxamide synthase [Halobacteriales archaeon QS_8_69_26]|nr:MAG: phosphoribosylaminoimidazolesuccinocarboxamide synthase [Halobacteriales archaeon QS_8_69_26]